MAEDVKSFLKKLKTSRLGRLFGNTNLRWFECLFDQRVFGYKDKMTDLKLRSSVGFSDVVDFSDRLKTEDAKMCEWNYGFEVICKDRVFILYCQTRDTLDKWKTAFNIILKRGPKKLANIEAPNFNFMKPKSEQKKEEVKYAKEEVKYVKEEVKYVKQDGKYVREEGKYVKEDGKYNKPAEIKQQQQQTDDRTKEKEVKVEIKEVQVVENELKRQEVKNFVQDSPQNKPQSKPEIKKDVIVMDDDDDIPIQKEEYVPEIKPDKFKKQEYVGEKPTHKKNLIPQLADQQQRPLVIKPASLNNEFDDNIENLIYEADKSFDNVKSGHGNINDKFYKHKKTNVRSSSAVAVENPGVTSNILKSLIQKDQDKKSKVALAAKRIDDWNYYDKEGKIINHEEGYNPATAEQGTKEEREKKKKQKAIASLLNRGVHLGLDSEEEIEDLSILGKSQIKDLNKQNPNIMQQKNLNKSNIHNAIEKEENTVNITVFVKEEDQPKEFIPKSILANSTVLYDNRRAQPQSHIIENKVKLHGLAHPETKKTYIIEEQSEQKRDSIEIDEINRYFEENKHNVQESKYNNKLSDSIIINEERKPVKIKAFNKLNDDLEDLDYQNQRKTVNYSQKVIVSKQVSNNNSILQTQNNLNEKGKTKQPNQNQNQSPNNNSLILGGLNAFDSNPAFSNNIAGGQGIVFNMQVKKQKPQSNMNSSFVEDLTDDWNDEHAGPNENNFFK